MSLNPNKWEKNLSPIPYDKNRIFDKDDYLDVLDKLKLNQGFILGGVAMEQAFVSFFENSNIPDELIEAYTSSMENVSKEYSLYERYLYNLEKGEDSVSGFINNLKGKYGEINFRDTQLKNIQENYPELGVERLELAPVSNYDGPDIRGYDAEDNIVFEVQSKIGEMQYTGDAIESMKESPEILHAVSKEIQEKIMTNYPEYSDRIYEGFNPSDYEIEAEVTEGLETLAKNYGIDLPDNLEDIVPYIGEVVLGLKLIQSYKRTEKDFDSSLIDEKRKINALKSILIINKFGFTSLMAIIGANYGRVGGGWGALAGALGGAVTGSYISKKIQPHLLKLALGILGLTTDDIFYYRNKQKIDKISLRFSNNIRYNA